MNQTTNPTPKNKKSKRNIIIGIALVLVVACIFCGVFSSKFSSKSTPTAMVQAPVEVNTEAIPTPTVQPVEPTSPPQPTDTPLPPPTEIPSNSIGALGERIEKGGIALTVLNASKTTDISFMQAQSGNIYLVIEVLIENVSRDDETPYNAMYFSVKDESGYEYQTAFASPDPSLTSGNLIKGDKVRGFIAFEVLNTSTQYIVTYEPLVILGGYEPIRIDLGTVQ